jgi:hypothetical protein
MKEVILIILFVSLILTGIWLSVRPSWATYNSCMATETNKDVCIRENPNYHPGDDTKEGA